MKSLAILSFIGLVISGSQATIPITKCDDKLRDPTSVVKAIRVSGCENLPCKLKQNGDNRFAFDFIPPVDAKRVEVIATAFLIKWPGLNTDACKSKVGITCPVKKGKLITYDKIVDGLEKFPKIQVPVEWKISLDSKPITCFQLDVEIV